jgi:L-lysine exporter family protein LysE/ArgO
MFDATLPHITPFELLLRPTTHASNDMTGAFFSGLLLMGGLIVAIGAQNAFILQQAARRQHVGLTVALCTLSDWLLTALGVFGLGVALAGTPWLLEVLRWGGAAFIAWYGLAAARRAWVGGASLAVSGAGAPGGGVAAVVGSVFAFTYLNPHVYIDTVLLMGTVGAAYPTQGKLAFTAGAGLASALWFTALGFGAAALGAWLQRPAVWRVVDGLIAVIMLAMAYGLAVTPLAR